MLSKIIDDQIVRSDFDAVESLKQRKCYLILINVYFACYVRG